MKNLRELLKTKEKLIIELNETLENKSLNDYEVLAIKNKIQALEEHQKIIETSQTVRN